MSQKLDRANEITNRQKRLLRQAWRCQEAFLTSYLSHHLFTGQSLGLECVTCEWRAGQVNDTIGCVSTPYKEPTELCEQSKGNVNHVCEVWQIYISLSSMHNLIWFDYYS